jgi:hypothetical protein
MPNLRLNTVVSLAATICLTWPAHGFTSAVRVSGTYINVAIQGDQVVYKRRVWLPPIRVFRQAMSVAQSSTPRNCVLPQLRIRIADLSCIRLSKAIRANADGNVRQIYARPLANVAYSYVVYRDLMAGNATGSGNKSVSLNLPPAPYETLLYLSSAWRSLEPSDVPLLGGESIAILHGALAQKKVVCQPDQHEPPDPHSKIEECTRVFSFRDAAGHQGMVACLFKKWGNFEGTPSDCSVQALRDGEGWLVAATITPDDMEAGFGGGGEGFSCSFKQEISEKDARLAVRTALSEMPLKLHMRPDQELSHDVIGERSGGQSAALSHLGKGIYYEKLKLFGTIKKGTEGEGAQFWAVLVITVNRTEAGLSQVEYALSDNDSGNYVDYVLSVLDQAFTGKLDEKCERE